MSNNKLLYLLQRYAESVCRHLPTHVKDKPRIVFDLEHQRTGMNLTKGHIQIGLHQLLKHRISFKLAICHELYHWWQWKQGLLLLHAEGYTWRGKLYTVKEVSLMPHSMLPWESGAIAFEKRMSKHYNLKELNRLMA